MRICAVSAFPPSRSGVADYGALLVDGFARDPRVERVTVLADRVARAPARERDGSVDVLRVWDRGGLAIGPELLRRIAGSRSDIVWFNLGLTMFGTRVSSVASALAALFGTRAIGRRTVITIHELPDLADTSALGFDRSLERVAFAGFPLLARAGHVVVTLERYRAHLAARYGMRDVTHIPHGLWHRASVAREPDAKTVLVFGMFGPHKDPTLVAEAIDRIRPTHPGLRLVIAGADHPRYPGFMAKRSRLAAIADAWIGYVPHGSLPALFADASVVALPTIASSGASGVIHRAVGSGRALVVSDLPDFRALAAEEDLTFEWFGSGDVSSLAQALDRLLCDGARRRAQVEHNHRSLLRIEPARTVDAYLDLFARTCGAREARRPAYPWLRERLS